MLLEGFGLVLYANVQPLPHAGGTRPVERIQWGKCLQSQEPPQSLPKHEGHSASTTIRHRCPARKEHMRSPSQHAPLADLPVVIENEMHRLEVVRAFRHITIRGYDRKAGELAAVLVSIRVTNSV